jgi:photosystem II stability/assembly factor-like uncharacterized protein
MATRHGLVVSALSSRLIVRLVTLAIAIGACGPSPLLTTSLPPPSPSTDASPGPTDLLSPSVDIAPHSVAFWDEHHGILVGSPGGDNPQQGMVATTVDGGQTWKTGPALATAFVRVTISGVNDAWATAACEAPCRPPLFHSGDGGLTWQVLGSDISIATFVDRVHGWGSSSGGIGGDGEQLYETHDGGGSWKPLDLICGRAWPEVAGLRFVDDRHGWIVCGGEGSGTMGPNATYETLDGGMKWRLRSSLRLGEVATRVGRPPSGPIVGAFFLPSGRAWVWQGRSGTETSRDGGMTWDQASPGKPEDVFVDPMWFVNDQVGFALVFADGVPQLWTTADGSTTWRAVHRW